MIVNVINQDYGDTMHNRRLTTAGVWADDSQIDYLSIQRGPMVPGGVLFVRVSSR
jgi:Holliday junction resolvase RusA-like endonuclease